MPIVTLGVDAHKRTHTVVAVDAVGKKTVPSTTVGHTAVLSWARSRFGTELVWGLEDCRAMTARLERDLMANKQTVVSAGCSTGSTPWTRCTPTPPTGIDSRFAPICRRGWPPGRG